MALNKTNAVIFPEPRRVELDEVDLPEPTSGDVVVDIEYSSISNGTERWCLTGKLTMPDRPPLGFPHVPGYQASGTIREVGSRVKDVKPGDRVFSRNCKPPPGWPGSWWGGHAGIHIADSSSVIKLPPAVDTFEASSLLLAQVGYNGASKPPVSQGDTAGVIGEGPVGQYAAQVLRHRGARVIMSGLSDFRLSIARQYSADEVFNSTNRDFFTYIMKRFPAGLDIVVETASSSRTVQMACTLLKHSGHLVLNGFYPPLESRLDWHWLREKELTVHCPNSRTRERLTSTLELIAQGNIAVKELVTHVIEAIRAPEAYEMLLDPAARFLGIVFKWK